MTTVAFLFLTTNGSWSQCVINQSWRRSLRNCANPGLNFSPTRPLQWRKDLLLQRGRVCPSRRVRSAIREQSRSRLVPAELLAASAAELSQPMQLPPLSSVIGNATRVVGRDNSEIGFAIYRSEDRGAEQL